MQNVVKIIFLLGNLIFIFLSQVSLANQEVGKDDVTYDFLLTNYDDYDHDKDGQLATYDSLCDQLPVQKLPYWRIWLNKIGSLVCLSYINLKHWFSVTSR